MQKLSYAGLAALAACLGILVTSADARQAGKWATDVKGQVVWAGATVPTQAQLNVTKDPQACLAKGPILNEEVVVNPKDKGVANVFVWITTATGGKPPINPAYAKPAKPQVELDQPTCAFEPHALAMAKGRRWLSTTRPRSPITSTGPAARLKTQAET